MIGISSFGAYVPYTRLPLALIGGGTAREGGPEKAVAYYDEDAISMGVAAAIECLAGFDRASVDGVLLATTTYPFKEKQGATVIAKALDLRRDVSTADYGGSLRAGTAALQGAVNAVTAGSARRVLVIVSDCRMGAPKGALERNFGDGAAAFLVSDADAIATLESSFSLSDEIQDIWRNDGDPFTHTWEDRFVVSQGYIPRMVEVVQGLLEKSGRQIGDFSKLALYAPEARSHGSVARRLRVDAERLQDPLFGRLGNAGAAFAPLLLAAALEDARPGDRLLMASYGDGAEALSFQVTEHVEKLDPRRAVAWHLARRSPLKSYESYLRSRGLEKKEWEAGTGGGLAATVRFRERDADISFVGASCRSCGQVHFPGPRVCYRCHTRDQWEPVRLSDKQGRVLSHTFDYFFPAPEPPTIMVMTEVEGARVNIQLADARPEDVKLDMPVEFVFRKIHDAGRKPNYFWKARPVQD